jgi:hypothetical protein
MIGKITVLAWVVDVRIAAVTGIGVEVEAKDWN